MKVGKVATSQSLLTPSGRHVLKPNKGPLLKYLLINIVATSFIVFLADYLLLFRTGVLSQIRFLLNAPSYIILFILQGVSDTLHFTSDRSFLIVSFIFYSALIAVIQLVYYRRSRKKL